MVFTRLGLRANGFWHGMIDLLMGFFITKFKTEYFRHEEISCTL
jgi:hypothetical protein